MPIIAMSIPLYLGPWHFLFSHRQRKGNNMIAERFTKQ